MIAATEFKCYFWDGVSNSELGEFLGNCLVLEGNELSEAQYLFEILTLGRDLGRNPYNFNISKYNGITEAEESSVDKNLILNESYILTDLESDKNLKLLIGLHYTESEGEYYLIKVPVNTTRVVSNFINLVLRNEDGGLLRAEEDSYILIMRNNQDNNLEFGSGTITTRSYLIAEIPSEINIKSYLANGSKYLYGSPVYLSKTSGGFINNNLNVKVGKTIKTPTNNKIKVLSPVKENWNDYSKGWKKGDVVLSDYNYAFECIVDHTNNDNFNDSNIWKRV